MPRFAAVGALALLAVASPARPAEFLALEGRIPLPAVAGRIDHMAVDLARKRLIVAEYGNDTLDVLDLASGKRVRRISGLDAPQGVGYSPKADLVAVSNGGDGTVRLYRGGDLAPAGRIALGEDADNLRIDPRDGNLIVAHGKGGLAVIDPAGRRKVADIALAAHPEAFQLDAAAGRLFANLPHAREIAVVDLASGREIAGWKVPGLSSNFPMALDESGRQLAVGFWHPPRLVLLDAGTGAVGAELASCADADDAYFDDRRHRLYLSCGAGVVDVFARGAGGYRLAARVRTAAGARTSLFVPALDRLYVAAPAGLFAGEAAVLVFAPAP
ncbi:MAG TPA: hypothetical protein VGR91_18910 [Stellaceae bacterium]|nr:hypothetical protein [Stellaceae bacterium]